MSAEALADEDHPGAAERPGQPLRLWDLFFDAPFPGAALPRGS